jgi:hypothetical protein
MAPGFEVVTPEGRRMAQVIAVMERKAGYTVESFKPEPALAFARVASGWSA